MKYKYLLLIGLILLTTTPVFAWDNNTTLEQLAIQQLAMQYDLTRAIHVFSGYLYRGWHDYGTYTIPKDWNRVYLVIIPYAESGHRITVKVNGYDVLIDRQLSSAVSVDITDYVQDTATINMHCTGYPRVKVLLCPPNPILESKEELKAANKNMQYIKYGLIGVGVLFTVGTIVLLSRRR